MIVFCEECGTRNVVDPQKLETSPEAARCKACGDMLRLSVPLPQAAATAPAPPSKPAPSRMEIRYGEQLLSLNQTRPTITMGRQEHNDLEVIDTRVSRSHARIEYREGDFVLIDHSTNGTFVLMEGRQGVNLRRAEIPLEGAGIITLGRKGDPKHPKAIHFSLKA
jgi:hypothetical protein